MPFLTSIPSASAMPMRYSTDASWSPRSPSSFSNEAMVISPSSDVADFSARLIIDVGASASTGSCWGFAPFFLATSSFWISLGAFADATASASSIGLSNADTFTKEPEPHLLQPDLLFDRVPKENPQEHFIRTHCRDMLLLEIEGS